MKTVGFWYLNKWLYFLAIFIFFDTFINAQENEILFLRRYTLGYTIEGKRYSEDLFKHIGILNTRTLNIEGRFKIQKQFGLHLLSYFGEIYADSYENKLKTKLVGAVQFYSSTRFHEVGLFYRWCIISKLRLNIELNSINRKLNGWILDRSSGFDSRYSPFIVKEKWGIAPKINLDLYPFKHIVFQCGIGHQFWRHDPKNIMYFNAGVGYTWDWKKKK